MHNYLICLVLRFLGQFENRKFVWCCLEGGCIEDLFILRILQFFKSETKRKQSPSLISLSLLFLSWCYILYLKRGSLWSKLHSTICCAHLKEAKMISLTSGFIMSMTVLVSASNIGSFLYIQKQFDDSPLYVALQKRHLVIGLSFLGNILLRIESQQQWVCTIGSILLLITHMCFLVTNLQMSLLR